MQNDFKEIQKLDDSNKKERNQLNNTAHQTLILKKRSHTHQRLVLIKEYITMEGHESKIENAHMIHHHTRRKEWK